jgi:hypothetical protein
MISGQRLSSLLRSMAPTQHKVRGISTWISRHNREIGEPTAAVLMAATVYIALIGAYFAASNMLSVASTARDAKQDFLAVLQRRSGDNDGANGKGTHGAPELFVFAATESLAAARIDDTLRRITREAGGIVLATDAEISHDDNAPSNRLKIRATIEGKIEAIQAVLFRLETHVPMIFVKEVSLEPKTGALSTSVTRAAPVLHASMTLASYWRLAPQRADAQ